ncbi:MAG TPA: IS110 family transposase [Actinomycetes bacterium]
MVARSVVKIAVDPHKRINAVVVVDTSGSVLARGTFTQSTTGFAELMGFARRWPRREWAVEGATGVGKNLAQRLVVKGETVFDVPSKKSSLVRAFSATSGRKSDDVDAYSVALACLHATGLNQVRVDERAETLRLLSHRRDELVGSRTQAVCRLHRELQILIAGGASRALTAAKAKALLASVRPRDEVGKVRKSLALDQLADLVAIDRRLKDIDAQIKTVVAETHTSVTEVRGVGPVVAAIVLGEVRDISRFPSKHHFASYNGSAPTTWGSAGDARPCVNLHGNRRLNHALHIAAIVQLRYDCEGRRYYLRKIAEGKTPKEARRCLKRRISDAIYHQLAADAQAAERGPRGQMGAITKISAADPTPTVDSSIKPQPGPHTKGSPAAARAS